ncbi:uncharacterized protein LOC142771394 isoform X2 [Rhipicephalus microplus]|uniref:uncharacterized protein LOC142771394 isoform X2 n=1 Tax=Rhipicephalus microplus TaxID=6941 RepID=UPI003F6C00A8
METKVFAAILILTSTIYTAGRDVKQFVGMSQKIWTVKTTNRAHLKCEVDQRVSIGTLSVLFDRSYLTTTHRRDLRIRGVFDSRRKKRMTLFYAGDIVYYDLRVTNSSITTRPRPSCPQYFSRIKGYQPSFTVYTPECQQII